MKFSEYNYERPDFEKIKVEMLSHIDALASAKEAAVFFNHFHSINKIRKQFNTMESIASIRYTLNTGDVYYDAEKAAMDELAPEFESLVIQFYKALLASDFKTDVVKKYGSHIINLINVKIKAFDDSIIEDIKEENKLMQQYTKLRTSAKIDFDGATRNLPQMMPFYEAKNSDVRKQAHLATSEFFSGNLEAFDSLYDKLVKVRDGMAKKLGFENYIPLGYMRLMRTDYCAEDVASYRKQVLNDLVPIATALRKKQMHRLKLDKMYFSDEGISFLSGNATPLGNPNDILVQGLNMYDELSGETSEFIHYLYDHELLDVEAREGKAGGGYCSFIDDYQSPFIFSNFNGTSGDVDVLTHEAGHAFQIYQSRAFELPEYVWPTLEACEIHSMSMEFITWPKMSKFFGELADKYRYYHLSEAILFIPYGTLVDHFQHDVYANPDYTPADRRNIWRKLEKQYLPHRDYGEDVFLENGGYWFRQGHIFTDPFYYIDYTLAQVCAFQFHLANQADHESTWQRYLKLCKLGGSKSFTELLSSVALKNPFEPGTVKEVITPIYAWLNAQNDELF